MPQGWAASFLGEIKENRALILPIPVACLRLLRAYATGQYRDITWGSLISIIASVIYFVMPIDLVPDFLLAFGFIDDAALLGWIIGSVKSDIENFIEWETPSASCGPDENFPNN